MAVKTSLMRAVRIRIIRGYAFWSGARVGVNQSAAPAFIQVELPVHAKPAVIYRHQQAGLFGTAYITPVHVFQIISVHIIHFPLPDVRR